MRAAARGVGLAAVLLAGLLTACSGHGHRGHRAPSSPAPSTMAGTGSARIGTLTIYDAYIPQPASPDVAAAYFVVRNDGATPDTLVSVRTGAAASAMPMTETDSGGSGTMTALGSVVIPAHGQFTFSSGRAHIMLEHPTTRLTMGRTVALTITFRPAGTVVLRVPVVSVAGPGGSMAPMPSMSASAG